MLKLWLLEVLFNLKFVLGCGTIVTFIMIVTYSDEDESTFTKATGISGKTLKLLGLIVFGLWLTLTILLPSKALMKEMMGQITQEVVVIKKIPEVKD